MAKKIIRRTATLIARNSPVAKAAEKAKISSPQKFEEEIIPQKDCFRMISALKEALTYSNIEFLEDSGTFIIGDLIIVAIEGGYSLDKKFYKKPIDILRLANTMARDGKMAPIWKGKTMDRIDLLRKRSKELGLHLDIEGPTNEDLDKIEEITNIPSFTRKEVFDEESFTSEENDIAIEYLCGGIVDDGFMPEISKEPVRRKEIGTVDMTEGLKNQMINMGLLPWEAEGDGELAILLIEEASKKQEQERRYEEAKKQAYRNYVRGVHNSFPEEMTETEMAQLIQMSY